MSSRGNILKNYRFMLFLYIVVFSTLSLWVTFFYGFNCEATDKPPPPLDQSSIMEIQNLKAKIKHYENLLGRSILRKDEEPIDDLPFIYAITPTFTRLVQKAELVRLSLAFLHVKNFHWIVVEDSLEKTALVRNFLQTCGLMSTHLNIKTNEQYQLKSTDPNWKLPRGVDQRNTGIEWLLNNREKLKPGVVYFADDDNTYSLQLFKEMRYTKKVSVWPVGLVGGMRFERPIISPTGKVTGWYTMWDPRRPFAMDMAGFAVNLSLLIDHPQARFDIRSRRGHVESSLLSSIGITMADLEPKADNCTKVYVWHTRTEKPNWKQEVKLIAAGKPSDPGIEV